MAQQGQPGTAGAGTDPAYVPDREVFGGYTHQQIWELVHEELAPAELSRLADTWGHTATAVETAFDEFARDLTRFSGDWSGLAAVAAARAAAAFVRAGDDAVAVCRVVEQLLSADSTAAESVRAAIPPPSGPYLPDPDPAVEAAAGAQRRTAYNTAAATLTAEAQDAMTFGYNPTIPASGDAVPRFTAPVAGALQGEPLAAGPPARPNTPAAPPSAESERSRTPSEEAVAPPQSASPASAPDGIPKEPGRDPDPGRAEPDSGAPVAVHGGESDDSPAATPRSAAEIAAPDPSPVAPAPPTDAPGPSPGAPTPLSGTPGPPSDTAAPPPDTVTSPSDTAALPFGAAGNPSYSPPGGDTAASAGTATTGTTPATLSTAPTVDRAGADSTGTTAPPRTPGTQIAGFPDRDDPHPTAAAIPPRSPAAAGWSPAETAGRADTTPATPHGGHRPGPVGSATPAAPQSVPTAADSDAGAATAQRPGQSEQIARSVPSRPTTEAARESLAPTGAGTDPATNQRSEHPWTRTGRPSGFPLPAATGPVPSRAPDGERGSPDYLHRPNEQLTATPPAVPPVFGEYTGTEDPDRTRPGDGNR
ncbi:hypothetical protein AB0H42_09805 [Nocardia sp. NPDC050799]|uniref:hypothetical protein n=1 Tax=Nocardia sp. NPDC050799 TaxID=3154842 RepID=UPI0033C236C7